MALVHDLIGGHADLCDPTIPARLSILRVQSNGDPVAIGLIDFASEVHAAALAGAPILADAFYLRGLIEGCIDLASADIFDRMEPMFARYEGNHELSALIELASVAYCDAAMDAAAEVLAGRAEWVATQKARDRATDL
jgi:hypothetical protein